MKKIWTKITENPLSATIIGTIIATLLVSGWFWTSLYSFFTYRLYFHFFLDVWMVILWVLAVILILISSFVLGMFYLRRLLRGSLSEPPWEQYISDTIFDIQWGWQWHYYKLSYLTALCPKCSNRLDFENTYVQNNIRSLKPGCIFICDNCDFKREFPRKSVSEILLKIKKEVDRRIRTGEFKQILEGQIKPS